MLRRSILPFIFQKEYILRMCQRPENDELRFDVIISDTTETCYMHRFMALGMSLGMSCMYILFFMYHTRNKKYMYI